MDWKNSPRKYGATVQLAHWASAFLVVFAWALGLVGDEFPRGPIRDAAHLVHSSAGELIAIFLLVRLVSRFTDPAPGDDSAASNRGAAIAAKAGHYLLYALLAAVIGVGVALEFSRGKPLSLFGLFEIASPWVKDKSLSHQLKEVHETLANGLMLLATLHAAVALFHHFYLKDSVLKRMLPSGARAEAR